MMRPQGPVNEFSALEGTSVLNYNMVSERNVHSRAGYGPAFYIFPAEDEESTPKRAESGLQGWIDCFEKASLKGLLFCGGVNDPREISSSAKLEEAYELGKSV